MKGETVTEGAQPAAARRRSLFDTGRLAAVGLVTITGATIVYLGFNAGGFFPLAPAIAALVATQILILRVLLAEDPFSGVSAPFAVAVVAMCAYCLWTLASGLWSHAGGQALIEFDRAFLYLLVLVVVGSLARSANRLRWLMRAVVAGIFVVAVAGFLSRTFPDVIHVRPGLANNRLSWPLTYSNALGLMAVAALVMCVAFSSSEREPAPARVLGAAAVPLLAVTVYLTFSRGPMLAGAIGLVVFAAAGRPRALLSGLLATVPASVIALVVAYHASLLASSDPTTAAATSQGHRVAAVTVACVVAAALVRLLCLRLDRRLVSLRLPDHRRRPVIAGSIAGGVIVIVIVALVAHVPGTIDRQYHNFVSNNVSPPGDFRTRLTVLDNGYRIQFWKVAMKSFDSSAFHGTGAGTYGEQWFMRRKTAFVASDAHSLYLETLSELGIVGLVLLALVLGTVLLRLVSYCIGKERALYAGALAAVLVYLLHAAIDWDWEMPAATVWVFALGGMALAAPVRAGAKKARPALTDRTRLVMAICLLAAAVPSVLIAVSQARLKSSIVALDLDRCGPAKSSARSSISTLADRPEPYLVLGYCDVKTGIPALGLQAMKKAVALDPGDWEGHYGLAAAQAAAGIDPRAEAAEAFRLNPRDDLTKAAVQQLASGGVAAWQKRGPALVDALLASGRSSVANF